MPLAGSSPNQGHERAYFDSLEELDQWASKPVEPLGGILRYHPRTASSGRGKLLVCHDYKGGYTESPFSQSYTFNFWSSCDSFVYFSHHRVTVPPPGWITAAHRQGVKCLGTLIFEGGAEPDCLRLLVGQLPKSKTGPALQPPVQPSLPLSPHYARVLADLAHQRGFDGYLLNFECPLQGGIEQTRAVAAWITLFRHEIQKRVGLHGEVSWYDSVVVTGQLAWQDRLNSLNLPFFLSSSSLFTNYTWRPNYPNQTAEYFMSLADTYDKSLQDIYMGVDVWGRGSHGGGGLGCYRALTHIAPDSLGLSVALFGQAWTWESEQDKPGWSWDAWWEYERTLWVGPVAGAKEVEVPEAPRRQDEPECPHGPFVHVGSFFERKTPPNVDVVPLHATFSPGVGRAWYVDGKKVFERKEGWTDVDKQTTLGDLVWPQPTLSWQEDALEGVELPKASSGISMEDAWNGGSCLRLTLSDPGTQVEDAVLRSVWLPIQSLSVTPGKSYQATAVYKVGPGVDVDVDVSLSVVKAIGVSITPHSSNDTQLDAGWVKLSIEFSVASDDVSSIGLAISIVTEDPSQPFAIPVLLGQLNVFPSHPAPSPVHNPMLLWADLQPVPEAASTSVLSWEVAASFPPLAKLKITSVEDPFPAWDLQSSTEWFPSFVYFNIFVSHHEANGHIGSPQDAVWIGTTGLDGKANSFIVRHENMPFGGDVRFLVQGMTDHGEVLRWDQCVFVDGSIPLSSLKPAETVSK